MYFQHLGYARQRLSCLLCILPVVICGRFSENVSSRARISSSHSITSSVVPFLNSTDGSGNGMSPQCEFTIAVKANCLGKGNICFEISDAVVCGFGVLTASSSNRRSLLNSISTTPQFSTSNTLVTESGSLSSPTSSGPSLSNSLPSSWTSTASITSLKKKSSSYPHVPGSSKYNFLSHSLTSSYVVTRSIGSSISVSKSAEIPYTSTRVGPTSGQLMEAKSKSSSTTFMSTTQEAANITTGIISTPTSKLQSSTSLSYSQRSTVVSSRAAISTDKPRPQSVLSSTMSSSISRLGTNSQTSFIRSQTISSSHFPSATSRALITATTTKSSIPAFYEVFPDGSTTTLDITMTITSPPPGFSTISASNSLWTGDTTIVSAGTTYPVIYGCSVCGGRHHGIILTGLGGKPGLPKRNGCGSGILSIFKSIFGCGSEFNFPPVWGLPPFVNGPLGNPIPLEPQPNPYDPEPDEEPETSPEPTSPEVTSVEITKSSASTVKASSTKASSTSACSATTSPIPYAIFLVDNVSGAELSALSEYFQEEIGGPEVVGEIPLGVNAGDSIFAALIDNCVASKIGTHPSVSNFCGLTLLFYVDSGSFAVAGTDCDRGY